MYVCIICILHFEPEVLLLIRWFHSFIFGSFEWSIPLLRGFIKFFGCHWAFSYVFSTEVTTRAKNWFLRDRLSHKSSAGAVAPLLNAQLSFLAHLKGQQV